MVVNYLRNEKLIYCEHLKQHLTIQSVTVYIIKFVYLKNPAKHFNIFSFFSFLDATETETQIHILLFWLNKIKKILSQVLCIWWGVFFMTVFLKLDHLSRIILPCFKYHNISYHNPCIAIHIVSLDSCQYTALLNSIDITHIFFGKLSKKMFLFRIFCLRHQNMDIYSFLF